MSYLLYLFSAFGLGALHALEPGHGKGVMGAYLVLSRGRAIHAVLLGLISAATHTLVVVLLAVTAHSAAALVATGTELTPDRIRLWLQLLSGLLIVAVGYRLLPRRKPCCNHHHFSLSKQDRPLDLSTLVLLGFMNGLMPCPGALAALLLSISAGTLAAGLGVVLAFGAGAALAMIGVGLVFLKVSHLAGDFISRRAWTRLAAVTGLAVMFIGAATAWHAGTNLL
ncbi:MAG: sulfite exporter TauE/SafE family protein [Bacillota bacterium]